MLIKGKLWLRCVAPGRSVRWSLSVANDTTAQGLELSSIAALRCDLCENRSRPYRIISLFNCSLGIKLPRIESSYKPPVCDARMSITDCISQGQLDPSHIEIDLLRHHRHQPTAARIVNRSMNQYSEQSRADWRQTSAAATRVTQIHIML